MSVRVWILEATESDKASAVRYGLFLRPELSVGPFVDLVRQMSGRSELVYGVRTAKDRPASVVQAFVRNPRGDQVTLCGEVAVDVGLSDEYRSHAPTPADWSSVRATLAEVMAKVSGVDRTSARTVTGTVSESAEWGVIRLR